MNETDIPCADCGTELVERTVQAREIPLSTSWSGEVQLAECPSCNARYYPEQALVQLAESSTTPRPRSDS